MKVHGSHNPGLYSINPIPSKPGYLIIKLYENVNLLQDTNGNPYYEYDEYHLEVQNTSPQLKQRVADHTEQYLRQAKEKEEEATLPQLLKSKVAALEAEKETLRTALTDAELALCEIYESLNGGLYIDG